MRVHGKDTDRRREVLKKMKRLVIAFLVVIATPALSQQRTFYGSNGSMVGRSATDSQGSTVIYDAGGRVTGRTSIDSQGTARVYSPGGRSLGTITGGGVTFGKK